MSTPTLLPANTAAATPASQTLNGVAALPHLGVIRVAGDEAAKFLHGQLTQDFALLKPDEADYEFSRYFMCDYASGRIEVNPGASSPDQKRANETLRLYRLNEDKLPLARRHELENWLNPRKTRDLEEFSFRDFIEAGL